MRQAPATRSGCQPPKMTIARAIQPRLRRQVLTPPGDLVERERGAGDPDERAAEDRVEVAQPVDRHAARESRRRPLADALQHKPGRVR